MTGNPLPVAEGLPSQTMATNAVALWTSKVVASLVLFAWQLVAARELGPIGFGIYGTIGAILAVASALPDAGLGVLVSRDVAVRPADAGRVLAATLVLQPALALAAAAGAVVAISSVTGTQVPVALAVVAALVLVIDTLGNVCHSQLVAAERIAVTAAIAVVHAVAVALVGTILVTQGFGLWGVFAAALAASSVRALVYMRALRVRPAWPADHGLMRGLLRDAWPLGVLMLLGLARLHADKVITTAMLGPAATGLLQAAFVVSFGVGEIAGATLLLVGLPAMARAWAAGAHARFWELVERVGGLGLAVAAPAALGAAMFGPPMLAWAFGAAYGDTQRLLPLMLAAVAVSTTSGGFGQALLCQRRQHALLRARTGVLLVHLMVLPALLPRVGVSGAAIAALVTEVFALLVMVAALGGAARAAWQPLMARAARVALALAGAGAVAWAFEVAFGWLGGAAALAVAYPGALRLAGGVTGAEWRTAVAAIGRTVSRTRGRW